jgi:hypothetical protein
VPFCEITLKVIEFGYELYANRNTGISTNGRNGYNTDVTDLKILFLNATKSNS